MEIAKTIVDIFFGPLAGVDPVDALKLAIVENHEPIININTTQLDSGEDSGGGNLGSYKFFEYKGRWQPVDLLLTGDFRDSFYLDIDDIETQIKARDIKTEKLVKKYGEDIFGIQEKNLPDMQELILPDFQNNYENQFQ